MQAGGDPEGRAGNLPPAPPVNLAGHQDMLGIHPAAAEHEDGSNISSSERSDGFTQALQKLQARLLNRCESDVPHLHNALRSQRKGQLACTKPSVPQGIHQRFTASAMSAAGGQQRTPAADGSCAQSRCTHEMQPHAPSAGACSACQQAPGPHRGGARRTRGCEAHHKCRACAARYAQIYAWHRRSLSAV